MCRYNVAAILNIWRSHKFREMLIHLADVPRGHEDHADKEDQVVAGGGHGDGGGPALLQTLQHGTRLTKLQAGQDQVPGAGPSTDNTNLFLYNSANFMQRIKMLFEEVTTSHCTGVTDAA